MPSTSPLFALLALLAPGPAGIAVTAPQEVQVTPEPWAKAVAQGRALIAQGKGKEARLLLQEADRADGGAVRTRVWYIRALIEDSFLNDALDMTDGLAAAGQTGPIIDYLYGLAFVNKARKYIKQGVNLSAVGMQLNDSIPLLISATEADPAQFGDAFLPLAEAAWNSQRLNVARAAAEQATRLAPGDSTAFHMLGEIAFSQFVVSNVDETRREEAKSHWQVTFDSFQTAASLEDKPKGDLGLLASAYKKSGDALVWFERKGEAATQYSKAMAASPAVVDFGQLFSTLSPDTFARCLSEGQAGFAKRHAENDPGDATLLWWLGYSEFIKQDYALARGHFENAYAKWPVTGSSQWYVALCYHNEGKASEAIDAVVQLQSNDPVSLNNALQSDPLRNLAVLDALVGHCYTSERWVDAGRLSAAQGNAAPETARYWNNVGLFYRDAGNQLPMNAEGSSVKDPELQLRYYEKALEGYERALEITPEDPALLNDTAVILHYYLDRELPKARSMYLQSTERAQAALASIELSKEQRLTLETALQDSQKNLVALDALEAQRVTKKGPKTAPQDQ